MKKLGLIGGMSHESTSIYYTTLNQLIATRLGGLHSAPLILWSFDFAQIEALQAAGDWQGATHQMIDAAQSLERAGADCLVICTNTMHYCADELEQASGLPVINIIDAVRESLVHSNIQRVLLLGTKYTMSMAFYRDRLAGNDELSVVVPTSVEQAKVNDIIYQELCHGEVTESSRQTLTNIVERYRRSQRCEAVILGCTELGMLLDNQHSPLPCFDALQIHCEVAAERMLIE